MNTSDTPKATPAEPTLSEIISKHRALLTGLPLATQHLLGMPRGNEGVARLSRKDPMVRLYDALFSDIPRPDIPAEMSSELAVKLSVLLFRSGSLPPLHARLLVQRTSVPLHHRLTIFFNHLIEGYGICTLQDLGVAKCPVDLPASVIEALRREATEWGRGRCWDIHQMKVADLADLVPLVTRRDATALDCYPWIMEVGVVGRWSHIGREFEVDPHMTHEYWLRVIEEGYPIRVSEVYRSTSGNTKIVISGDVAICATYRDIYGLLTAADLYLVPEVVQMFSFYEIRKLPEGRLADGEGEIRSCMESITLREYYGHGGLTPGAEEMGKRFDEFRKAYLSGHIDGPAGRIYFKR
jgi:hypothetical protein